ncbi:MAG: YraN family protein [Solirubrobacteraceae bacterium]
MRTTGRSQPSSDANRGDAKPTDPRHALGRRGEEFAAKHLHRLGFSPLGRNERTRYGEIDLVAFDGKTLVFVEVKTRRVDARPGRPRPDQQPLHWLRPRQRIRLRKLATAWLTDEKHIRPTAHTIRFDAIGVMIDSKDRLLRLDHVEGAW